MYRFFVVYRPPDTTHVYDHISCLTYMSEVIECLEHHVNTKGPTIIVGDFNCPDMDWRRWSEPSNLVSLQLYKFATSNGFMQLLDESTRGNNILDLVLINEPVRLSSLIVNPPFSSSDHNSVGFTIAIDHCDSLRPPSVQRKYLWK